MAALEPDPLFDAALARFERLRGPVLVADFPVEDVVRLALAIRPQQDFVGLRLERIGDDWQWLVLDLHGLGAVDRSGARLGKDSGHFLILEERLANRQDHLLVEAVERRQPAESR